MVSRADSITLYRGFAIGASVFGAMFGTWFVISRYPVPDSDAINVGLFAFLMIALLTLFAAVALAVADWRQLKRTALVLGGGFLAAAVLGGLAWGVGRIFIGRPQAQDALFFGVIMLLWLPTWITWRKRRKAA